MQADKPGAAMPQCPFCEMSPDRVLAEEGPCALISDLYPVAPGHALIIPRRHISSFREMTPDEWAATHRLAQKRGAELQAEDPSIQGFNLGINDGRAAGQTIPHCHIHLLPRRTGDVRRPEGGVRGVIPSKARYGQLD